VKWRYFSPPRGEYFCKVGRGWTDAAATSSFRDANTSCPTGGKLLGFERHRAAGSSDAQQAVALRAQRWLQSLIHFHFDIASEDAGRTRPTLADAATGRDGGEAFGIRTDFHITKEEYERRDKAAWPEPTESTIVAHRTADGIAHVQGGNSTSAPAEEEGMERVAIAVPHDSKWRARLMDVYKRRALPSEVRQ
jgi:hypothetical protein